MTEGLSDDYVGRFKMVRVISIRMGYRKSEILFLPWEVQLASALGLKSLWKTPTTGRRLRFLLSAQK